jgi:exonuclease, DNA polymerase III, epsilon subunit family
MKQKLTAKTQAMLDMVPVMRSNKLYVVADIETTGLSHSWASIIEIGAVLVDIEARKIRAKMDVFVKLSGNAKIPPKIVELTNITDTILMEEGITISVAMKQFKDFIQDYPLVFHNGLSFDLKFLNRDMLKYLGCEVENPVIDSYPLAQLVLSDSDSVPKNFKLGTLVAHYGAEMKNAHRASADCAYTAGIFVKLRERLLREVSEDFVQGSILQLETTKSIDLTSMKIIRISPWAKGKLARIYIRTNVGEIYYDLNENAWMVKELKGGTANPKEIGQRVLELQNMDFQEFLEVYHPLQKVAL